MKDQKQKLNQRGSIFMSHLSVEPYNRIGNSLAKVVPFLL